MKVICGYCGKSALFVDSSVIYGISYGMIYYCADCKAWVGVHKGTDKPLGSLANEELRKQRKIAHAVLDRMWRDNRKMTRKQTYQWLSHKMGLTTEETHIGLFDMEQCRQVIEICRKNQEDKRNVQE